MADRPLFSLREPLPSGLGVFAALSLCGDLQHASLSRHILGKPYTLHLSPPPRGAFLAPRRKVSDDMMNNCLSPLAGLCVYKRSCPTTTKESLMGTGQCDNKKNPTWVQEVLLSILKHNHIDYCSYTSLSSLGIEDS